MEHIELRLRLLAASCLATVLFGAVTLHAQEQQERWRSPVKEEDNRSSDPPISRGAPSEGTPTRSEGPLVYNRPPGATVLVGILVANVPRGAETCLPGGGTGPANEPFSLAVLAPADHVGLTIRAQPSFYWSLSAPATCPIEVTVIDETAVHPLLEVTFPPPFSPGLYRLRLTEHGLSLQPGGRYRWSVALIPDPEDRSKDLIAGGAIQRIEPTERLRTADLQADKIRLPFLYAEEGLWYDALETIADLLAVTPHDPVLRRAGEALLAQGGLQGLSLGITHHIFISERKGG